MKLVHVAPSVVLAAFALVACGGGASTVGAASQAVDTGGNTVSDCAVFVDKVATIAAVGQPDGYVAVVLYVHVDPSLLDSAVSSVALYAKGFWTDEGTSGFETQAFSAVTGAANEYFLTVFVSADNPDYGSYNNAIIGAIYAETQSGAKYWLNPAGGGNFTFDQNFASHVGDQISASQGGGFTPPSYSSITSTTSAAASGSDGYVNPLSCSVTASPPPDAGPSSSISSGVGATITYSSTPPQETVSGENYAYVTNYTVTYNDATSYFGDASSIQGVVVETTQVANHGGNPDPQQTSSFNVTMNAASAHVYTGTFTITLPGIESATETDLDELAMAFFNSSGSWDSNNNQNYSLLPQQ